MDWMLMGRSKGEKGRECGCGLTDYEGVLGELLEEAFRVLAVDVEVERLSRQYQCRAGNIAEHRPQGQVSMR